MPPNSIPVPQPPVKPEVTKGSRDTRYKEAGLIGLATMLLVVGLAMAGTFALYAFNRNTYHGEGFDSLGVGLFVIGVVTIITILGFPFFGWLLFKKRGFKHPLLLGTLSFGLLFILSTFLSPLINSEIVPKAISYIVSIVVIPLVYAFTLFLVNQVTQAEDEPTQPGEPLL